MKEPYRLHNLLLAMMQVLSQLESRRRPSALSVHFSGKNY